MVKTFKDLEFKPHPLEDVRKELFSNAKHAKMYFDNGYGVSVVFGTSFYSNGIDTYELAVLFDNKITYDTDITDDVVGYITEIEVSEIMQKVQLL